MIARHHEWKKMVLLAVDRIPYSRLYSFRLREIKIVYNIEQQKIHLFDICTTPERC